MTFSKVRNSEWHRIATQEILRTKNVCEWGCAQHSTTSTIHRVRQPKDPKLGWCAFITMVHIVFSMISEASYLYLAVPTWNVLIKILPISGQVKNWSKVFF